jgi:hypothetical protein
VALMESIRYTKHLVTGTEAGPTWFVVGPASLPAMFQAGQTALPVNGYDKLCLRLHRL